MSLFIPDAWAQGASSSGGDPLLSFLPLVLIFVVFYFLLIRPQAKRTKEHRKMVAALAKGDEVVTTGGLVGQVTEMGENFVRVEIAGNVQVRIQRQAISTVLPKGSLKKL
ncbi:preprotein translocase subunit YajC [bacterium BMS3Bbin12]|nr:preprotein translocase subunit YajC [bacterium BMS3Abin12]GBE47769.1 preprotein translocase subunit YajC [bacterium BMS3Bbin12]GBE49879.1 preprotein translocase subunit YajC [bacterium BMS3Bbin13]HDJ86823.1 preprotein translocase subunit YajC [Chromatiales bacterium]HDO34308.1 preprotein translocase subunit YajC [Chromatiales bacterium]